MKKRRIMAMIGMLGMSSSILIGCDLNKQKKTDEQTEAIQLEQELQTIEVDGKVVALDTRTIVIDFPATIERINAKRGDKIKKDQPILTLNIEPYLGEVSLKENELEMKRIQLSSLKQTANPQVATLAQLKESLTKQQTKLQGGTDQELKKLENMRTLADKERHTAQQDYEVAQKLFEVGGISEKEVKDLEELEQSKVKNIEDIELQIEWLKDTKQSQVNDLQAQIKSLQAQLTNADLNKESLIAIGQQEIEGLELVTEQMKEKLNKPYIKDNQIIGVEDHMIISELIAEVGMQTGIGIGPIIKLVGSDTLAIELDVPEEYGSDISLGQEVRVSPIGNQNETSKGKITSISNQVIESYGENVIKVEVNLKYEDQSLRLGQSIEAEIMGN